MVTPILNSKVICSNKVENVNALHAVASLPALIAEVSAGVVLQTVEEAIRCAGKKADAGASVIGGRAGICRQHLGSNSAPTSLGLKIWDIFS